MKGVPRRFTPILRGVREELTDGAYTLVLEFEKRPDMPLEDWTSRQDKFQSFFGPGIKADLKETDKVRKLGTHPTALSHYSMSAVTATTPSAWQGPQRQNLKTLSRRASGPFATTVRKTVGQMAPGA